jgi:hypothetical protein
MRVFILCSGRSGSLTIIKACTHIENFTSGHESLAKKFGQKRFDYPENHIEADNRLSWHLGQLNKIFGNKAFYVHLKRNRDEVAQSFLKRFYVPGSIIDSFCEGIRMSPAEFLSEEERLQACYDYIDTVNSNIEHFMSDKRKTMTLNLENVEQDFSELWNRIAAQGNLGNALNEFKIKHNIHPKRKFNYRYRIKLLAIQEWRHFKMCVKS